MRYLFNFLFVFVATIAFAQNEYHVFPVNGPTTKGHPNGDGSIHNPWDLKTGLSQTSDRVNGGDIIWIHEGIYSGRFRSLLNSTGPNAYITVAA